MWISTSPGSGTPYCPTRRPLKPRLSFVWVNPSFVATSACEGHGVRFGPALVLCGEILGFWHGALK
jgi:hypothetical protein